MLRGNCIRIDISLRINVAPLETFVIKNGQIPMIDEDTRLLVTVQDDLEHSRISEVWEPIRGKSNVVSTKNRAQAIQEERLIESVKRRKNTDPFHW